ncbi:YeeE/YedE family protein [Peijinzhouia sedimentorum]
MEWITQPWSWYASGLVIAFIMVLLIFFGKSFGFSSNLRTMCSMAGAGKVVSFFKFDWKKQSWNLLFVIGSVIGGYIANTWLNDGSVVEISQATINDLAALGIAAPVGIQPTEIFSWEFASSAKGLIFLIFGGFLVGFGARWAGGCTSGHAISGLSDLQVPSLIAVVGFFIGGLVMTHFLLPFLI